MTNFIICLSGRIGSGKSTIATKLAEHRQARLASFGRFIRGVAAERGLDPGDRAGLQRLGEELIAKNGYRWLSQQVISASKWTPEETLIIEGIRHIHVMATINNLVSPRKAFLIHLNLSSAIQLSSRGLARGVSPGSRERFESHSTEQQVLQDLPSVADLVVDAELPVLEILTIINRYVDEHENNRASQPSLISCVSCSTGAAE